MCGDVISGMVAAFPSESIHVTHTFHCSMIHHVDLHLITGKSVPFTLQFEFILALIPDSGWGQPHVMLSRPILVYTS